MRKIHRVLTMYSALIVLFVVMFAFVIYFALPSPTDLFTMALSIVLFALIPIIIAFLVWRHHKH